MFSIRLIVTGQHDRQDEKLTGQLPNQSGHGPLTGRYFEPCYPSPNPTFYPTGDANVKVDLEKG